MASAGPYASLHLAADRQPHQRPPLCFLQAGCPSCRPTNSVKALKARLILTNKTVQENTDKQTQYKSEKLDNLKYSRTKLPWFSCLLQHSARKRGGLILQRPRAHTGPRQQNRSYRTRPRVRSVLGTRSCRHALCPAGRTARPACSLCTASTGSVSAASGLAIRCSRL